MQVHSQVTRHARALITVAFATLVVAGCSKEPTPPELSAPAKIILISGDAQIASGPVAAGNALVVRVTDPKNRAVSGVPIIWSASDPTAQLSAAASVTDSLGQASVAWTLGNTAGRQTVTATTVRIVGASVVFQAVNSVPVLLTALSGDNQTGDAATALPTPLVVKLTDASGNPSVGATVTWSALGGGSVSPATSRSDAQGQASAVFTLAPTPGLQSAIAQTSGPPATRAVFTANTGASISGGVTIVRNQTWSFSSSNSLVAALQATRGPTSASWNAKLGDVRAQAVVPGAKSPSWSGGAVGANGIRAASRAYGSATRRLIVQFKPEAIGLVTRTAATGTALQRSQVMMQTVVASQRARGMVALAEPSPTILATRVTVPEDAEIGAAITAFLNNANVESVTVDSIVPMLERRIAAPVMLESAAGSGSFGMPNRSVVAGAVPGPLPNNPLVLTQLWHYNLVDAPRAWASTTGSANVLVAVVDDGIRFEHPAISANLTRDGYNFVAAGNRLTTAEPVCGGGTTLIPEIGPSADPTAPDDLTDTGTCWSRSTIGNHGLHVAGTIGAQGNSAVGTSGLNWTVRIRPVRVLDITGSGSYFDIAQGILYAAGLPASNGTGTTVTAPSRAAVINMSLGGSQSATVLANAVAAATNAGSLIIAAAGNDGSNAPFYPAAYAQVLSVAALGPDLQLSSYSNVGTAVSLVAPGGDGSRFGGSSGVASTTWDFVNNRASYGYYNGTSMASPHVAGVAALVLAANPTMTAAQLRTRLQNSAVDIGPPGRDDRYGYGIVNAYNAVANVTGVARTTFVRLVNALTGDTVRTVAARADGSFAFTRLAVGSYFVTSGQDEAGDGKIGVPGRPFGWFGGGNGPTLIALATAQNATATPLVGVPIEFEPNNTTAQGSRMVMNSFVLGQISVTDTVDVYTVQVPRAGTYYFETSGVLGSCGYALELDTVLSLLDANGATLQRNDDATFPGSRFCSQVTATLAAGTYYARVSGAFRGAYGQYRLWVRDQP